MNYLTKSTGQMSFATFFLNWAGSIARCITLLVEAEDWAYRAQGLIAVALTTTFMIQFIIYRNS